MRVLHSFNRLLRNFLVIGLLASVLTSAYLDSFLRGIQSNLLKRSIPASLATAPQGAVGYYQPPPGPAVNYPYQLQTTSAPSATTTGGTVLPTGGNSGTNGPRKNIALVSGTVTGTHVIIEATQSAMANRDLTLGSGGFLLSILLGILQF
ncbi:hypothetical protein BO94DRAFT_582989 [Aspergillus sclerotioniger CBS 115572]|uniref:Uncharacterized protein n=1 Tax=Aspergillus sclerotioniger CBS 115572 TaxID=1450535 RepID=A0A317X5Z7_9EURO|nr:hypothetical protein BO94DRAFT_582989 [Aspergillus sclerotioniger CBS 115572]PWY93611.1 hypothetical protein BO94DRAFT_582989 [Aspergillus sclerotioniger CBS 115572]